MTEHQGDLIIRILYLILRVLSCAHIETTPSQLVDQIIDVGVDLTKESII